MSALKSLAEYAAEYAGDPVVLALGDGTKVTFPRPTYGEFLDAQQEGGNDADVLALLARPEDQDVLAAALRALPAGAVRQVAVDVYAALMGNGLASPVS